MVRITHVFIKKLVVCLFNWANIYPLCKTVIFHMCKYDTQHAHCTPNFLRRSHYAQLKTIL
jgi:hypothetical protein